MVAWEQYMQDWHDHMQIRRQMENDLVLRRKWTVHAQGQQIVLVKKPYEKHIHVLMKAFLWALYLPQYPNLTVETAVNDRFKPDLVALDEMGKPYFWGEAGHIPVRKIRSLIRRYRSTHFAIARWKSQLEPVIEIVNDAMAGIARQSPVDLITFQENSGERFVDQSGHIQISHEQVEWIRVQ
jgi:hypothetical protein